MVDHVYAMATLISPAPTAVASLSAAPVVTAQAMPVPNRIPLLPPFTCAMPVAGIGIVNTGVSVPTVGADALLYSFRYLAAALMFDTTTDQTVPALALVLVALVLAALFVNVCVGVTGVFVVVPALVSVPVVGRLSSSCWRCYSVRSRRSWPSCHQRTQ